MRKAPWIGTVGGAVSRRDRHGRSLRAGGGSFPSAAVGRRRLLAIAEAAQVRLIRLARAGHPGSQVPAVTVQISDLPDRAQIGRAGADDLLDGALLAQTHQRADGTITVTLFALALQLGSDGTTAGLTHLVRQTLAEQVATELGMSAHELDPEAE